MPDELLEQVLQIVIMFNNATFGISFSNCHVIVKMTNKKLMLWYKALHTRIIEIARNLNSSYLMG